MEENRKEGNVGCFCYGGDFWKCGGGGLCMLGLD